VDHRQYPVPPAPLSRTIGNSIVRNDLANSYADLNRHDEALKLREETLAAQKRVLPPDHPDTLMSMNNLGLSYAALNRHDEAITCFRKAIEIDPKYVRAYINLGNALRDQGKAAQAVAAYRKAVEIDPSNASAHDNLGYTLHVQLKKVDEAIVSYRRAIELNPKYAQAHINLGNALKAQGKADEAMAAYREAFRLEPENKYARDRLGLALNDRAWALATALDAAQREPDRAVKLAKEAIELAPKAGNHWNTLGAAYYRAGNWKESITALQKYRELRTDDAEWTNPFFLAMAHWQLGEKQEARKWFDKGVEWMERKNVKSGMTPRLRAEAAALLGLQDKKESGTKEQESEKKPD
jgi:tetratricopeptide (TPR) repeat protein